MDLLHTVLSLANIVLILVLLYYFHHSYREVQSKFTLGLLVFGVVFLINEIFRSSIFYSLFTAAHSCPYTSFYTVAGGFELVALLVLIYQVRE
jgi:hypothetical protein